MKTYSFATLISSKDGDISVSHIPLILDTERGEFGTLIGHLAKANIQWKNFEENQVLCIFNGPNGYISPSWYEDPMNVPTWNYATVHAHGKVRLIHDEAKLENILHQLVLHHESKFKDPWQYNLPQEFRSHLTKAIIGFEIEITSIEGKFKLSQNRSLEDWNAVITGVEKHYTMTNPELVVLMKEEFKSHKS